ncbi:MAG: hypothetical protein ACYCQI_10055 [Gammaproteobacteria bacterium]
MYCKFFSKTDRTPRKPFFNPKDQGSVGDALAGGSDRDRIGEGTYRPADWDNASYRRLRFLPPVETLDDILEKLLRNAEFFDGRARSKYLEKMLKLLQRNPELVNRMPNNYHSRPLELALRLGELKVAEELLKLDANVRPENRDLLQKVAHLLRLNNFENKFSQTVVPFRRLSK